MKDLYVLFDEKSYLCFVCGETKELSEPKKYWNLHKHFGILFNIFNKIILIKLHYIIGNNHPIYSCWSHLSSKYKKCQKKIWDDNTTKSIGFDGLNENNNNNTNNDNTNNNNNNNFYMPMGISDNRRDEIKRAAVYCIFRGLFPLNFFQNQGLHSFLKVFKPNCNLAVELPGLSPTNLTRLLAIKYNRMKEIRTESILKATECNPRSICLGNDSWTSRSNDSYFAITISYAINYKPVHLKLGCFPFNDSHTIIKTEQLISNTIQKFVFNIYNISSMVKDTAPNSIGAFKSNKNIIISNVSHT